MAIRAVVFDIGGVLENAPETGWEANWEAALHLPPGAVEARLADVWRAGSVGTLSLTDVEMQIAALLGLNAAQVTAFMADLWDEYLGTLNTELATYFAGLRPRYRTGIISNSFVGAREQEQARYGFGDLCDVIVYSHEVGVRKPDPRIFELACTHSWSVQPGEMIFVDDVPAAVAGAQALGIHGILCQTTAQAIADVEACLAAQAV